MKKDSTLDQRRARHAWSAIEKILKNKDNVRQEYAMEVKRLPVRIQTAGLGQALGFLYAKSDGKRNADAKSLLLKDLAEWLLDERRLTDRRTEYSDRSAILQAIIDNNAEFLRRATGEALIYLQWLGRFAEAELKQN